MSDYGPHYGSAASWIPDDHAGVVRQQTLVEAYRPPAYIEAEPTRYATTRGLVEAAPVKVRRAVGTVLLVLGATVAAVFLIALVILGIRLAVWLA
jgi:hypothetical protein